jgi:hypothetical protein
VATAKFFIVELLKKKVYIDDISTLSILLNLKLECHTQPFPNSVVGSTTHNNNDNMVV